MLPLKTFEFYIALLIMAFNSCPFSGLGLYIIYLHNITKTTFNRMYRDYYLQAIIYFLIHRLINDMIFVLIKYSLSFFL